MLARRRSEMSVTRLWLVLLLVGVVVAGAGCGGGAEETSDTAETAVMESATAPDSLEVALPVLLDLGSDSCVPCKAMAPVLDEMSETFEGQLIVRFVDVRKNPDAAREHNIRIIPTQIFLDEHGHELSRHQGFFSREDMLAKWSQLGYEFEDSGE
jgi:thioredoxin 1